MRPLDKGTCPQDVMGNNITVNDYDLWRGFLIGRIGYYCVYCNVPLSHSLQVEHVIPKSPPPGYIVGDPLAWNNMLLACGPCNNAKGNNPVDRTTYYLPEEHNTLLPFTIIGHLAYPDAAIVAAKVNANMNAYRTAKANQTITLMTLDRIDRRRDVVDIRWQRRKDAMVAVEASFNLYLQAQASPTYHPITAANHIALIARSVGFFSIWFEIFRNEPQVIERLIDPNVIPGTAQNCFDPANGFSLLPRNPGDPIDDF